MIGLIQANPASAGIEEATWEIHIPRVESAVRERGGAVRIDPHPDGIKMWLRRPT